MPSPAPGTAPPPTYSGPDIFNPPLHRGWITFTPSISLFGEYNDNLDLTSQDKVDDFIMMITPGFTLSMQRPHYRFLAGYNFAAEFYANETENNDVAKRQNLFADGLYRLAPGLTFTISESFVFDRESNVVTTSGISAGRQETLRNTITPTLQWQATPRTALNFSASYTLVRFVESGSDALDSDTYRGAVGAEYSFSPRLSGTAEVAAGILDVENEPTTVTFTPRVGLSYQFTRTLRGFVSGGPSVAVEEDDTGGNNTVVTPAGTVGFEQSFKFGYLQAVYDRAVTAESFGVADRQSFAASLFFPTLRRGFNFGVTARYARTDEDLEGDSFDHTDTFSVNLQASYQIATNISLIGAYTFYKQIGGNGFEDIDQNRVFLGLQYAYPINFD